jgi:hypothetical protein
MYTNSPFCVELRAGWTNCTWLLHLNTIRYERMSTCSWLEVAYLSVVVDLR